MHQLVRSELFRCHLLVLYANVPVHHFKLERDQPTLATTQKQQLQRQNPTQIKGLG